MIALLSPAKKMAFTELPGASAYSQPRFLADTEILIERARKLSRPRIAALMGISETLADLNWRRFREFSLPFTPVNARPAILAFRGDTYVGLDADTLKPADLTFAQDHVRILSGLYGLLRPLDLIQPYRLEMGARLGNVRGRDLYKFWGDRVTDAIVQDSGGAAIVNLASEEYFKAVRPERLQGRLVTPVFHEIKDG
ncbi:MAG: YaaA family protein, partial [Myxococcales bacterium]|nr:YaaA family protein [Myxococcales bacterium]